MDFMKKADRIWLEDQNGKEIAYVSFPETAKDTVTVMSTVADPSLRGQGVASALMEALSQELNRSHRKAILSCSYAKKWFAQHPEYSDLLSNDR